METKKMRKSRIKRQIMNINRWMKRQKRLNIDKVKDMTKKQ